MLEKIRTVIPASTRGMIHAVAGPLAVLLGVYGLANNEQGLAIAAAVVAVLELGLATLHAENTIRTLIYPALAAVAAVLVNYGVADEQQLAAILGVVAAVIGSGVAAAYTPTTVAAGRHRLD